MTKWIAGSICVLAGAAALLSGSAIAAPPLWLQTGTGVEQDRFCNSALRAAYKEGKRVPPRLLPRDEASSRPEFARFRQDLVAAAKRRDAQAVLQVATTDFMISGGDTGIEYLRRDLARADTDFWDAFLKTIALGGSFGEQGFLAPYVYTEWPVEFETPDCVAIVGRAVSLRARPDRAAELLARLDYDIVEELQGADTVQGWTAVRTAVGLSGYVSSDYVRSPSDYRAWFTNVGGQWRFAGFVAGD